MKLHIVIEELQFSERELAGELSAVAIRHRSEHEIHHTAENLAGWSRDHLRELDELAPRFGVGAGQGRRTLRSRLPRARRLRERAGRPPDTGLRLLRDLRRLHQLAAGVSVDWELLAQGAQAAREPELLELAARCHPGTLRQLRWTNAMLKVLSPQILAG
ncbi:hypothetical protein [Nocardia sp. NBC_01329]|uniref:hypothetical protein n=1 Tax=Nocardia sp. NBC_01329 TaxID=2903594 RepID=UPI002E13D4CE|nr:hypothetical protein OG405_15580 [Nocardia sp. NBC_01329]